MIRFAFFILALCIWVQAHGQEQSGVQSHSSNSLSNRSSSQHQSDGFLFHIAQGDQYFQDGNYAKAILHFEKARLYTTRDRLLLNNLKQAYERTDNRAKTLLINGLFGFKPIISNPRYRDIIVIINLLILIITGLLIVRNRFFTPKHSRHIKLVIPIAVVTTGLVLLSFIDHGNYAVLMHDEETVYASTSTTSDVISVLNSGYKLEIIETIDDWSRITLATGQAGWIKNTHLEEI